MKPTTKLPGSAKPARGVDLLSPKTWLLVGPALAIAVGVARMHRPVVAAVLFALMIRPAAAVGDALEGAPRQRAGLKVTLGAFLGLGMYWPAPHTSWGYWLIPWAVLPAYLAVYATRTIGSSGSGARKAETASALLDKLTTFDGCKGRIGSMRAAHFLRLIADDFTTGQQRMLEAPTVKFKSRDFDEKTGTLSIWFTCPQTLNSVGSVRAVAARLGLSTEKIQLLDLHTELAALHRINFTVSRPFSYEMPARPAMAEWPEGQIPLGCDEWGNVVYLDSLANSYTAGTTGSGKTDRLINLVVDRLGQGHLVAVIDLKKVDFAALADKVAAHADNVPKALEILEWVAKMVDDRTEWMKHHGHRNWTKEMGPFVTLVIDECHDLYNPAPAPTLTEDGTFVVTKAAIAEAKAMGERAEALAGWIAHLCRAAGIGIHHGTQNPTTDSLPRQVKANTPVVVGLRVADGTAARVIAGESSQKEGFDLAPKGKGLPVGRAVVIVDNRRFWVQTFKAPELTRDLPAPVPPPTSAWPGTDVVRPSAPDQTPHTQGEQAADGRTDGHDLSTDLSPDLKGLEARILPILNGDPLSGRQVAEAIKASPDGVNKALKRLETKGLAVQNGGWLRAT